MKKFPLALVLATALGAVTACSSGDDEPRYEPISLTVAHVNDHHSQLDGFADTELTLDGVATRVHLGGFPRLTTAFAAYAGRSDVLKLHAGDAITGTLYYTLFKGEADAALMNTVCFDAFTPGNHEFDDGDTQLRAFVDRLQAGACKTPVLSANVKPKLGTPLAKSAQDEILKPYVLKTVGGVRVAVIGLTVKGKTTQSSRPLSTTEFEDEATAAQRTIDQLKAQGIQHIVLLTHLGYEADKALAARLTEVDAIIGGDSHTLVGDYAAVGLTGAGTYPTKVQNRDGATVCVGQAWEYGKALGEMNLRFDDRGRIASCDGRAPLLIGSTFKRKNGSGAWVEVDATTRQQLLQRLAQVPAVKVTEPDAGAASTLQGYASQVAVKKAERIGTASEALCLIRVPGDAANTRSNGVAGCESVNTQARGSDAAQVVAEAFLSASLAADVAIQNAGGVRIAVPAGPVTMNTAFTLLPFTNVLVELKLTGAGIVSVLEDAVANHLDLGGSDGSHPYAAGLRWNLDMSKPRGQRFSGVEVRNRSTGAWSAIDPARSYTVVTNDFIASGKDGYATFGPVYASGNYVNNYLLYTQTFVDYVLAKGTVSRPAASAYSHKSVVTKAGVTLP